MAQKTIFAAGAQRYGTRMLQAGDPVTVSGPEARLLAATGRFREIAPPRPGELAELRAEYFRVIGKRAYNGWDAATLREKIAAA